MVSNLVKNTWKSDVELTIWFDILFNSFWLPSNAAITESASTAQLQDLTLNNH